VEKLKFPIIRSLQTQKRWLSMDDYLQFVLFNLKYTVTKKHKSAIKKWKNLLAVRVPFSFK